jgi:hypothetical protein
MRPDAKLAFSNQLSQISFESLITFAAAYYDSKLQFSEETQKNQ